MDAQVLFRRLAAGAKFDFKRFKRDADKLQIRKGEEDKRSDISRGFDSFKGTESMHYDEEKHITKLMNESSNLNLKVTKRKRELTNYKEKKKRKSDKELIPSDNDFNNGDESEREQLSSFSEIRLLGDMKAQEQESVKLNKRQRKKRGKAKKSAELIAELKQEKVNSFRNQHKIHVYGSDIPDPVASFEQLKQEYDIQSGIMAKIQELGYDEPTPIQTQAIPVMLHHREILACAPTGSGKTVAFLLPILHHLKEPKNKGFRALILAPTRELAKQTYRECMRLAEGRGFRIHFIEKSDFDTKIFGKKSSKKFDILVTTPNRLIYMLKSDPPVADLHSVEWLVVDESDKLFEEGKQGFRDQLATIYKACDSQNVRRALFSATCAFEVEDWCKLNLDNLVSVYIGAKNAATETVKQELLFVGNESGKLYAVRDIIRKGFHPPMLVFVQSKERAEELYKELIYNGVNVDVIHAGRTQEQRDAVVKSFRSGSVWVLICTELMGRGIDFKGVNLVVNYDFPNSAISYIHRIGRTGRAGHAGRAVTFFTEQDAVLLRSIANVMKEAGCPVPDYMLKLKKPNKKERKQLAKHAPKRDAISTTPKHQFGKMKVKKKIVPGMRRKQQNRAHIAKKKREES